MHVHNSCDAAGICPNAERLARRMTRLGATMRDVIITWLGDNTDACNDQCGSPPDGDSDIFRNPLGWTAGLWTTISGRGAGLPR